ncbi:uncharacterized protein MONOS_11877 [Monocercomonoides exilis]|uniref:uncharacterized protein n=1 Tax=Monocercomonoides exilis TaxID=2049356 RepID=UPI00355A61F3|nr:hypothetical protein MONOS_11877 [Monocercomonoides exilis]|eukprot:MONOS_11877.1-p1 / transcript=MONOS_11877.1 / gene=MONOS_11877 / organism=Monocercomonoides_exilis_PA203 / gene_product=unspecified product / transcript_product=unspecified product / location=Mono_scaffold00621:14072-15776(+) / protein_length=416 / sequence_SO=supercontig / SO=protein_coding / is_pseudo=false
MSAKEISETDSTKKFNELFSELEHCDEDDQRKKILEMNEAMEEMDKDEFTSALTEELFDKIYQMIEENKLHWGNVLLLLKHIGFINVSKIFLIYFFDESSFCKRFEKMIVDENEKKKDEKNEKLLTDLCECYLLLYIQYSEELIPICVSFLLKAASKNEEGEKTQKEVEMALLALSCIDKYTIIKKDMYLEEIIEIIKYHQEHHNLTTLAYQSSWKFMMNRLLNYKRLEDTIVNELHFSREAASELEDLIKSVDWKREKKEEGKEGKEVHIIDRWLTVIDDYFSSCKLWNEELAKLIDCVVRVFRASKDYYRDICYQSIDVLEKITDKRNVKIDALLKSGTIDAVLKEIQRTTLDDEITIECLRLFLNISERLKDEEKDEMEEAKRKATKRKIFEKMEEEGYEDTITTFNETIVL